jgi:hypothetical protein
MKAGSQFVAGPMKLRVGDLQPGRYPAGSVRPDHGMGAEPLEQITGQFDPNAGCLHLILAGRRASRLRRRHDLPAMEDTGNFRRHGADPQAGRIRPVRSVLVPCARARKPVGDLRRNRRICAACNP